MASQGGNVYSFGGIANNVAIANAYKYTPATNTWTPIASLPAPRGWFSGASDGTYIYLLGGVDQNFNTTATLWRYDPVSNTYNTSLPSYTIPTYFHASAYLNGKIYRIAGGRYRHRFSRRGLRYCHKYLVDGCKLPICQS